MWVLLLLPPPFSLVPVFLSLDSNIRNIRVYQEGIIATRDLYIRRGERIYSAEITEASEYCFLDKPIRDMLFMVDHESETLDTEKPLYIRMFSGKSPQYTSVCSGRKYAEIVNSNWFERMLLGYLSNQRKGVRVLKCSIKE